jgi:hypothetical protein
MYGMWKHRRWGWWLTLVTGMTMASVLIYSAIDDGWNALDIEDASATAAFLLLPLLLFLPGVRKYYRQPQNDPSAAIDPIQGSRQIL